MAEITQNRQKRLIFIGVPQFRLADGSGFVTKRIVKQKIDSNSNNDNKTESLNNHSDNSICLMV